MNNKLQKTGKRVVIVGGVAGGASCAARLRRLDEDAEILILERGPYVSFANCGLPYYVGGVIEREEALLVASPELFRQRFRVEVRTGAEVVEIDRMQREVVVREGAETRRERYDVLVLSPGAAPIRPSLPGIDLPGIFTVRTIPDSRAIRNWMGQRQVKDAVVVGGGFIGLEMAENLAGMGCEVTLIEKLPQVMPPLDFEMATFVHSHLEKSGVRLVLGDGVASFREREGGGLEVETESGGRYGGGVVILAIGVRPEVTLARKAGLELGPRGGIKVDNQMRTSDPKIFAVGDAVESVDFVLGGEVLVPLAGPANRQGRIVADVICGRDSRFRGVQGTAVCSVFGQTVACTGASEKALRRAGFTDFEKVFIHPNQHAGYYPGAQRMTLKLIFKKSTGEILGAQAVGFEGVDKRVDVIAMAIQMGGTVYDLEEAELCYAPQYGAAKDPVNYAGMVAADVLRGDMKVVHWDEPLSASTVFLDVRDRDEFEEGHLDGAVNIPLGELRNRLEEIPDSDDLRVYCAVGLRGYIASRILNQRGRGARNLSGGYALASKLARSGRG